MSKEYYDILWISENATADEIKKAYRKKAMDSHPDRHGWDKTKEAEFKKVNEAYATLSDPQKKAHYDRFWNSDFWGGWFSWWFNWWFDANFDISDIFESFFGGWFSSWGAKRKVNEKWEDLELRLNLDFWEAIFGVKKKIKIKKQKICSECSWTGAKKWTEAYTCNTCHWSWQVRKRTQSFFGMIEQTVACDTCHWAWKIIDSPCEKCKGKKRIAEETEKEIEIPAWIENGMSIKLKWEWNEWVNGKNGDLYLAFSVPNTFEWLTRDWDDLHFELIIDPIEATLWVKKKEKIPLIWERIIEIKTWAQYWDTLKFKWDWVKNVSRDIKWDLYIHLKIVISTTLSKKERELYEELAKEKWIEFHKKWLFW